MDQTVTSEVQPAAMPNLLFLVVTLSAFALSILFSTLALFPAYPELSVGITYDLAFTSPLFYYLAIRKTRIPKSTVIGVAALGIFTAGYLLPANQQTHLGFLTFWILPFLEIGLLGFAGYKAWRMMRIYKKIKRENTDVHLVLKEVFVELLGQSFLSRAAAFEASVVYYAFLGWIPPAPDKNVFSYHKKRGTGAVYGVFAFLIIAETFVLHVLIANWSVVAAWVFSLSSVYVLILLIAQYKATYLRPIVVSDGFLRIRCGLFSDADIPLSDVVEFECRQDSPLPKEIRQAALLKGFEPVNFLISTSRDATATGPYGIKSVFRKIGFFVDDKERLMERLETNDA